ARALFDLWVDAAEDAYAKIALSREFQEAYGKLVDAQMRVRRGVQRAVEQASAVFGMPTRTELAGAHRRIVALQRQLRGPQDDMGAASGPATAGGPAPAARTARHAAPARKTRARAAASRRPAAKSQVAKKQAPEPARKET